MEFALLIVHGTESKKQINFASKIKEYCLMLLLAIQSTMANLSSFHAFKH
jgi:hypothetical protein